MSFTTNFYFNTFIFALSALIDFLLLLSLTLCCKHVCNTLLPFEVLCVWVCVWVCLCGFVCVFGFTATVLSHSPFAYVDPLHCNMAYLYLELLKDSLNEYAYAAELAGLGYDLQNTIYGMYVSIQWPPVTLTPVANHHPVCSSSTHPHPTSPFAWTFSSHSSPPLSSPDGEACHPWEVTGSCPCSGPTLLEDGPLAMSGGGGCAYIYFLVEQLHRWC